MMNYLILCSDVNLLILRLETICDLSVSSSYRFMRTKSKFNPKFDSQSVKGLLTPPLWGTYL
jgi:hypothetical protein